MKDKRGALIDKARTYVGKSHSIDWDSIPSMIDGLIEVVEGESYTNKIKECECKKEWLTGEVEINGYPYGENVRYLKCSRCGRIHDCKIL